MILSIAVSSNYKKEGNNEINFYRSSLMESNDISIMATYHFMYFI